MGFTIQIQHRRGYLLAQLSGPALLADLMGAMAMCATVAEHAGYRKIVINMLAFEPQLSFTDQIQLGTHAGPLFERFERVATVVTPLKRSGVSEKAAQKSGARLQAFTNLVTALEWIGDQQETASPHCLASS